MNEWSLPTEPPLSRNTGVKPLKTQTIQVRHGRQFSKEGPPVPHPPISSYHIPQSILSTYYVTLEAGGPLHEIRKQHPKPWPLPLRTEHSGKKTHQETVTTQSDKGHHERFQQRTRPVLGSWEGLPEERCELASKGGGRKRGGGDFTKRDEYMQESRSERPWGFRKGDREVQCGH